MPSVIAGTEERHQSTVTNANSEPTVTSEPASSPAGSSGDAEATIGPRLRILVLALPVLLVVAVVTIAGVLVRTPDDSPVALGYVQAPLADSDACTRLVDALPESLGADSPRAPLADPAPVAAAAWRFAAQSPTAPTEIVLRCGLDRPSEFTVASPLQLVNDVQWFQISGADQGFEASTWFAVDREVYIALTLPTGTGPEPIQLISETIAATLPAQPIDPAPIG